MKKILLITSLLFISCIYAQPKSLQRDVRVQQQQELPNLRQDRVITVKFNENEITGKQEYTYDANGNQTLFASYYWDTTTKSFVLAYTQISAYDVNGNQILSIPNGMLNTKYDKYESAYDANGNRTSYIRYYWNTTSQSFVPRTKVENYYDVNGRLTPSIKYTWSTTTQSFVPYYKYEFAYDSNGNQILEIAYSWNSTTQSFVQNSKFESTYDANGNLTLYIDYLWNDTTQSFVPYYKYESTFDANRNKTLNIEYTWDTTTQSFVLGRNKYEFAYDANGNRTLYIHYSWNDTTQSFVPKSKYESTYDANGNLTSSIQYSWDEITQSIVPNYKVESTYDSNGNQTLDIRYTWDDITQSIVPNYKVESTYDSNGNQTLFILYSWDFTNQSFIPVSKKIRTFSDGLLISDMNYKWYTDLGVYKPSFKTEYTTILDTTTQLYRMGVNYQYDTNFNVWKKLEGEEFTSYAYYTKTASLSSPSQTIENNIISLYPNPTSQMLYISHPELNSLGIQIVDLNGKQMYLGTIQKDVPLDVSTYTPGMYLVTIENKETNKKNTYKIIKK